MKHVSAAVAVLVFVGASASQAAFSGYYRIAARHSGKVLNVTGQSTADGAAVIQWPYTAAAPTNDEWQIVDSGSGYHRLVNRHSGKVLTIAGASTANGAAAEQRTWATANHQMWQVSDLGTGFYNLVARHSGKFLDVNGASTADGAIVQQWTGGTATNQQWQITAVGSALDGPGLSKITFSSSELFTPIGLIQPQTIGGALRGIGLTTMHKGWLATIPAADSGKSPGGFAFYDISNPRAPVLISKKDVPSLREAHGFARTAPGAYPGDYVVLQAGAGIEFWDWTDVRNPTLLKAMSLPGVAFSDYDVGAWWLAWQAPFVYVAGSGNGIFVVDATDPRNPTLVKQIPTSQIGGFRIHPLFVVGNLLVATSADFSGSSTGMLTMDVSDPRNPTVIKTQKDGFPIFYSAFFNGNMLIGLGFRDHQVHVWDMTNPAVWPKIGAIGGMDRPAYATVQDGHALVGDEHNFVKINLATNPFTIVGRGTSGITNRSEDIATPLGNVVVMSNDHPTASAIIVHKTSPDNTGPSVTMVNPANNATNQRTTSRVGITLSDWIELRSVNNTTFIVRPVGGSALAGKYSGEQGILNFWPNQPFVAGTTYEVVIPAGGIKDFSGNGVPTQFTSRFTIAGTSPTNPPTVQARVNAPAVVSTSVGFAITSSSGGSLTYSWDFGDGSAPTAFSTSSTASHTYASAGHYAATVTARNTAGEASSSFTQVIHNALTADKPAAAGPMALDASTNRMWVVNPDTDTVAAIDTGTHAKVLEKPVGLNPRTLGRAPDGTIWVVNQGSATISVLAADTGNLVQTITLPYASQPYGIAFAPDDSAAYVTTQGSRQLLKLDPSTRAVVSTLNLGFPARGVAVSHDSARILVTRFVSPANRGEVVEVSGSTFTVVRTIALAFDNVGPDGNTSGRGVPNYISAIAISPDGRQARVPSKKDNTARGQFRDGQALDFETTVRTILSYVDLGTNAENFSMRIDFNDRDMAQAVAYSPLGDYVFVATQGTNTVEILSAYDNRLITGIPDTGLAPQALALSASGQKLFVQNFMSRTVAVYDVSGIVNSTTNQYTKLADVDTVATEKLTAQVLKGKQIFYNAGDSRMSLNSYIACASCHLDGGSDERVWDFTDRGEGLRNTVMLRGRGGLLHGNVHWSANFDEIQDFENDIRNAFSGSGFMTDAQFLAGTRRQPLGDPKNGLSADLDALAAYVTSLNDAGRSPFRTSTGAMTSDGSAGRALFNQLRCASCHAGPEFTDSQSGFRHDVGTIKASSGGRLGGVLDGIDTPTLNGVWETGPYLHDGSSPSLLHVLTTANASGLHGNVASLTSTEQSQLVAYLSQIDETESASAPSELYVARLDGGQEVPPVTTSARGQAKIVVLSDGVTALVSLQMQGVTAETMAHIHGPAGAGANAGVLFTLPNGAFKDHEITLSAQNLADLRAGLLYVNVHTSANGNGEIRGQLRNANTPQPLPTSPTPIGPTPTPTPTPTGGGFVEITPGPGSVTASTNDGNVPGNTVDNDLATRWSGNGDGAWIQYDLGTSQTVAFVKIAVYNGNGRQNHFDLQVSNDGTSWTNVMTGASTSGTTTLEETHDFADQSARYVRYLGHMSTVGTFNSLTEVSLFAPSGGVTPTATPTPTPTPTPTSPSPTPTPTATPTPGGFSGYYRITARHSGKAVVVEGASTANSANVIQWTYTSGPAANDEWTFSDLGSGYYHIVNRHTGKAMNVVGASTANAGDVIQWPTTTGTNDDWQMVDLGTGYYRIVNRNSGKVLNVSGASTADGANVDQWSWANVNQQQFEIVSVP
jgi:DNA-binding beta-propeller fold protein YncE